MEALKAYIQKARGGRVVRTPFLSPQEQDWLRKMASSEGLKVSFFGGFPMAERRCAVLYPEEVPSVSDPVKVVYLEEPPEPSPYVGEVEELEEGVLVALLPEAEKALLAQGLVLLPPPEGALRPLKEGGPDPGGAEPAGGCGGGQRLRSEPDLFPRRGKGGQGAP